MECALDELSGWLDKTLVTLNQAVATFEEQKLIEAKLANIKVSLV